MKTNKLLMILLSSVLLLSACQKKDTSESKESGGNESTESTESGTHSESSGSSESGEETNVLNKEKLSNAIKNTLKCYEESSMKISVPGEEDEQYLIENANGVTKLKVSDSHYEEKKPEIGIMVYLLNDAHEWILSRDSLGAFYGLEMKGLGYLEYGFEDEHAFDGFTYENDTARATVEYYGDLTIKVDLESGYVTLFSIEDGGYYMYNLAFSDFGKVSVNVPAADKFEINSLLEQQVRNLADDSDIDFTIKISDDPAKEYGLRAGNSVLEIHKDGHNDYLKSEYVKSLNDYIFHRLTYVPDSDIYVEEFNVDTEDSGNFSIILNLFEYYLKDFDEDSFEVLLNDPSEELILKTNIFGATGKIHYDKNIVLSQIEFELSNDNYVMDIISFDYQDSGFKLPTYSFTEMGINTLCQNTLAAFPKKNATYLDLYEEEYWFGVDIEALDLSGNVSCRYYSYDQEYSLGIELEKPDVESIDKNVYSEYKNGEYIFYAYSNGDYSHKEDIDAEAFNTYLSVVIANLYQGLLDFEFYYEAAKTIRPVDKGVVLSGTYTGADSVDYDFEITYIANDNDTAIGQIDYVEYISDTDQKTADTHLEIYVGLIEDYRLDVI